jgi:hypothetical protein
MNSKKLAKHMMDSTKTSLQRFKKAVRKMMLIMMENVLNAKRMQNLNICMGALDDISAKNYQNGTSDPIKYGLWDEYDPKNVTRVKGNQKVAEDIIKKIPDYERTKEKKTEMQGKYLLSSDLECCTTHTKVEEAAIFVGSKASERMSYRTLSKISPLKTFKKRFP